MPRPATAGHDSSRAASSFAFFAGTFGLNFQMTTALMATQVYDKGAGEYGILGSILAIMWLFRRSNPRRTNALEDSPTGRLAQVRAASRADSDTAIAVANRKSNTAEPNAAHLVKTPRSSAARSPSSRAASSMIRSTTYVASGRPAPR